MELYLLLLGNFVDLCLGDFETVFGMNSFSLDHSKLNIGLIWLRSNVRLRKFTGKLCILFEELAHFSCFRDCGASLLIGDGETNGDRDDIFDDVVLELLRS